MLLHKCTHPQLHVHHHAPINRMQTLSSKKTLSFLVKKCYFLIWQPKFFLVSSHPADANYCKKSNVQKLDFNPTWPNKVFLKSQQNVDGIREFSNDLNFSSNDSFIQFLASQSILQVSRKGKSIQKELGAPAPFLYLLNFFFYRNTFCNPIMTLYLMTWRCKYTHCLMF